MNKKSLTDVEHDEALSRLSSISELFGLDQVDLVIEAATENETLKAKIFKNLSLYLSPETILALYICRDSGDTSCKFGNRYSLVFWDAARSWNLNSDNIGCSGIIRGIVFDLPLRLPSRIAFDNFRSIQYVPRL